MTVEENSTTSWRVQRSAFIIITVSNIERGPHEVKSLPLCSILFSLLLLNVISCFALTGSELEQAGLTLTEIEGEVARRPRAE